MRLPLSDRLQPLNEQQLIKAAANGDKDARDWLIERYEPTVQRFTRHMMGNHQDAHDVAQDTMIKALKNLHRYDDRWRFSTWLISIARNTCIDEFRRRKRRSYEEPPDVIDPGPSPLELAAQQRRAVRLQRALATIPPLYRDVLVLYHFEHLKYQEIADLLEIPIGTVMNRIFRARRKLRAAYEKLNDADNEENNNPS
ncbi:MAG: RNA polymerase sigma factor [Myxococcota bacterium]